MTSSRIIILFSFCSCRFSLSSLPSFCDTACLLWVLILSEEDKICLGLSALKITLLLPYREAWRVSYD